MTARQTATETGAQVAARSNRRAAARHATPVEIPVEIPVETAEQTIARLQAENAALKARPTAPVRRVYAKRTEKGGVSLYGLGRFPVSLYPTQWDILLLPESLDMVRAQLEGMSREKPVTD